MSTPDPLRTAELWSRTGLYSGLAVGGAVGVFDLAFWLAGHPEKISHRLHSFLVASFVTLVICGTMGRIGIRIMSNQRMLVQHVVGRRPPVVAHAYVGRAAVIPRREVDTQPILMPEAPEDDAGLTPEMVAIARRTSARLRAK